MATSKKPQDPAARLEGKGAVRFLRQEGAEGGALQITVDFSQVAPPALYYYGDALALRVDELNEMAHLYFGRAKKNEAGAREFSDSLEIVIPAMQLFSTFWLSTRDVEAAIDKALVARSASPGVRQIEPPQAVVPSFFSNMIFIALGNGEVALDFYHLPPRDIHLVRTKRTDEMTLVPCLRVMLSVSSAKAFFLALRPHVEGGAQNVSVSETRNEPAVHT